MSHATIKVVKLQHAAELNVEATVDVVTGRPLVVLDGGAWFVEDFNLTPREAEALGRALFMAAAKARAKATARKTVSR